MPPIVFPGEDIFARYRQENLYYVDKTGFLEEFLTSGITDATLFTRPRRFGKTLMLSMMAEFFDITKDSSALFEGLTISRNKELCRKWMNQYPVIFLTFDGIEADSFELARDLIGEQVSTMINRYHPWLHESPRLPRGTREALEALAESRAGIAQLQGCLSTLCLALRAHYGRPVIILVDEYDFPAGKAQEHGFYDEMLSFLTSFLSEGLKTNFNLQFGVMTGCLHLREKTIFSGGLNNLNCFDMSDVRYADAFGFTEAEVAAMLETYGMSDKMDEVRGWYDGYHFGKTEHIYNPWGITKYVEDHLRTPDMPPRPYWLGISHSGITKDLLSETGFYIEEELEELLDGGCVYIDLDDPPNYDWLFSSPAHIWSRLFVTGYLTRAPAEKKAISVAVLWSTWEKIPFVFPSRDVRQVFAQGMREWFREKVLKLGHLTVHAHFWDGKAPELARELEKHMANTLRECLHDRFMYHMLLLSLFDRDFEVSSRRESGAGRYDIAVRDEENGQAAVIEIVTGRKENLASLAGQALLGIAEKKLDADLRAEDRYSTILHWGIAFDGRICRAEVKEVKIRDSRGE